MRPLTPSTTFGLARRRRRQFAAVFVPCLALSLAYHWLAPDPVTNGVVDALLAGLVLACVITILLLPLTLFRTLRDPASRDGEPESDR